MRLLVTEAAEADLAEIWAYLALEASEAIATRLIETIQVRFDRLTNHPLSGPSRNELAPNLRATFHGSYVIYYLVRATEIVIVRVLHGARDARSMSERGEFEVD
jgi:toxin ParE1/3/4